ncbi:MAG: metallophosphoesterase family protein [Promethearchaeota archaeon]
MVETTQTQNEDSKSSSKKDYRIKKINWVHARNPNRKQFIVYSDNRNLGIINRVHRTILRNIKEEYKDFIVHLGDFVFWDIGWFSFFRDYKKIGIDLKKTNFFPERGNHDNPLYFNRIFGLEQRDYAIVYENFLIILLDDNKGDLSKKQLDFVEETLEKFKDMKWKAVMLHKPLYSGAHGGVRKKLINKLVPLFKKYGVQLSIGSHYHSYEKLLVDGIWYLVSAGGGAQLTDLSINIPELIMHKTIYNYVVIEVKENLLHISVKDKNGQVIDEFNIEG